MKKKNAAIGSSLQSLLEEEGVFNECNAQAIKQVLAWQLEQVMKENGMTKSSMAEKMNTSRAALDRLLDPENTAVTLHTIIKAASAVGRSIRLELI